MRAPPALLLALALVALARPARAAGDDPADVRGAVGFVSDRSVYVSVGSEAGVGVGAEAIVLRDGRRVGTLRIEAVASRSAVATTLTIDGAIRPGDVVIVRITRAAAPAAAAPAPAPGTAGPPGALAAPPPANLEELWLKIETAPARKVSFRRGGAAVAGGPRAPTGTAAASSSSAAAASGENIIHGSITLGYAGSFDRPKDGASGYDYHAPRASANVTVDKIGGESLTLRFRGDARGIVQDQDRLDRSGAKLDRRIYLTELSLTWLPDAAPVRVSVGRTFAADAAQAGLVDGGRAGARLGPVEVGGFGGLDAAPDLADRGRMKYGAYGTIRLASASDVRYDGAVAFVRTTDGGRVDRQLLAIDQRLTLVPWLTIFNLDEIDLYSGTANPEDRPATDLTDVYAGARIRPLRFLDLGVSYDRRRIFFGQREADALFPATLALIDTGPWTTFRADGRVDLPLQCYLRAYWDRRLGAGGGIGAGGEAGCDAVAGGPLRLAGGGSLTRTRYVSGESFFGRAGVAIGADVDVGVSYTVTFDTYDVGGGALAPGDEVTRHEPRVSLEWFLSRSVMLYAEGGYEFGDEARRASVSVALTYRF